MPHLIAMLSEPRSGSSLIIQLLHCCQNVEVIDEPFHEKRVILEKHIAPRFLAQLEKYFGESISSPTRISEIAHEQTALYLRAMADSSDKEFVFFKIFRMNLAKSSLYECILNNPDVSVLILRRNSLHTFISWKKAEALSSWSQVDTTSFDIELDLEEFYEFFTMSSTWFDGIFQEMKRQNSVLAELHYDEFARLPTWRQLQYIAAKLHFLDIELQLPQPDKLRVGLTIQDSNQSAEQKVSNLERVRSGLRLRGLDHLIYETYKK